VVIEQASENGENGENGDAGVMKMIGEDEDEDEEDEDKEEEKDRILPALPHFLHFRLCLFPSCVSSPSVRTHDKEDTGTYVIQYTYVRTYESR